MHGKLLKINNEIQASPTGEALQIPEFKKVVDECDNPLTMLGYIYHNNHPESPYSNRQGDARDEQVKEDLLGDEEADLPDVVEEAEEKYIKLTETPEQKMLDAAVGSLYSLVEYLEEFDPTERDKNGKLVWKPKNYIRNMEKLSNVVDTVQDLRERVMEGEGSEGKIRGDVELTKWNE